MKLLSFGAIWCASCLVMESRLTELVKKRPDLQVIYYDYDLDQAAVRSWRVRDTLPTLILTDQNDVELTRIIGEKSVANLLEIINKYSL